MPASAFTHPGFRAWVTSDHFPAGIQATYVEGEVLLELSPEAIDTPNEVKTVLTAALASLIASEDLGEAYADGVLVTNTEAALSTEPDFTFVSWASFEEGRVRFVPKRSGTEDAVEIEGTPDLVVEIVSDSSV